MVQRKKHKWDALSWKKISEFRKLCRSVPEREKAFIEKYLHIRTKDGLRLPCVMNASQVYVFNKLAEAIKDEKPMRHIILKSRQVGMSTLCSAMLFNRIYNSDNVDGLVVAHVKDRTTKLFQMHHLFYRELPEELQLPLERSTRQELIFADTGSSISLITAGTPSAGRGGTTPYVHASEAAFYPDLDIFLGALQQAVPETPNSMVLFETTPYGTGTEFHAFWQEAWDGESRYEPIFVPWQIDPECQSRPMTPDQWHHWKERFLTAEHYERMQHYELNERQIRWYVETLHDKCRDDELLMCQEYPCDPMEGFISSGQPVFPMKLTNEYRMLTRPGTLYDPTIPFTTFDSLCEAPDLVRNRDTYLEIWRKPEEGRHYVISADGSAGFADSDFSSAFVFDMGKLDIVAEVHGRIDPDEFAKILARLGYLYNTAMVAPEINGNGLAVQQALLKVPYINIFQWRMIQGSSYKLTNQLGWVTNVQTRPLMISEAKRLYREKQGNPYFIPSKGLIDEIGTFVMSNMNLKPVAASGCHDDRVMSWAIGLMVCILEMHTTPVLGAYRGTEIKRPMDLSPDDVVRMVHDPRWVGAPLHEEYDYGPIQTNRDD